MPARAHRCQGEVRGRPSHAGQRAGGRDGLRDVEAHAYAVVRPTPISVRYGRSMIASVPTLSQARAQTLWGSRRTARSSGARSPCPYQTLHTHDGRRGNNETRMRAPTRAGQGAVPSSARSLSAPTSDALSSGRCADVEASTNVWAPMSRGSKCSGRSVTTGASTLRVQRRRVGAGVARIKAQCPVIRCKVALPCQS